MLVGCAMISGVDQFQKGDCPGGCADGQSPADGSSTTDGSKPDGTVDSGPDGGSMGMDGSSGDDSSMGTDSGGMDAGGMDAGGDGCGPLNTVQNCTMCGGACDMTNSQGASCNGQTCQYQSCNMGWSDCNTSAPDFDGCECNTPSCCGNMCQTTHSNGIGQSFYDCTAKNTYTQIQAIEACTAYTGNSNLCSMYTCVNPKDSLICGTINNICACWDYSGTYVGHVSNSGSKSCVCAGGNDPQWD